MRAFFSTKWRVRRPRGSSASLERGMPAGCAHTALARGGGGQSVEYLGWTFSPLIAAIALFAAIAASPMPTVISVILPG
jgi:hypothetical protein